MTLEEFFTSIEMQNGISTTNQVEELITLIQEERDCDLKSVTEAIRQHSAVARVVADTGNKSCLDLFINLGGLLCINRWLNDALKPGNDNSGDLIEKSVSLQFRALEKLHIDNEKLISSGILATVKNLCEHNSSVIKDKAKELLRTWKDADASVDPKGVQKVDSFSDDGGAQSMIEPDNESTDLRSAETKEKGNAEMNLEATDGDTPKAEGSESRQLVKVKDMVTEAPDSQIIAPVSLDHSDVEGTTSAVSETEEKSRCCPVTPVARSLDSSLDIDIQVAKLDAHKEITQNGNLTDVICNASDDQEPVNNCVDVIPEKPGNCSSGAEDTMTEQAVPERTVQEKMDSEEGTAPTDRQKDGFVKDTNVIVSERSGGLDDPGVERSPVRLSVEHRNDGLDDPGHQTSPVMGTIEETSSRLEDLKTDYDLGLSSQMDEDYSKGSAIQNLARDNKTSKISDKRSDIDMDYGIMDALEVARQVAKAVEREVVDNKSSFCGSASENKSEASGNPGSTGSINESGDLSEEASTKSDSSSETSSDREVEVSSSENVKNGLEAMQDVSQLAERAQDNQTNAKKDICEFDLNEEVPCENVELLVHCNRTGDDNGELVTNHPTATLAPSASCSRSSTVSAFPIGTSQFVGSLGWKGSAATSAFHQPSPHTVADSYDMHPSGSNSCTPKQKPDVFCIDLNVAEEDERDVVLLPGNEITSSSNILNKEPCAVAGPKTSERPEFDLNMTSDVDDAPSSSSWRIEKQHFSHFNGRLSDSPASSSSSIQPWMNIDLNDGPSVQSMQSRLHPFFGMSATQNVDGRGGGRPVISIMGSQVEVSRNNSFIEPLSLPNGRNENHGTEANMGDFLGVGSSVSYANPFPYGQNNMSMGSTPSFPPSMFRPGNTMTCMSDPRVGMFLQTGSSSAVPPMYSQPPFFMRMPGPPPGLNGFAQSRPNIDLNLGGFVTDGGNREGAATRQLFINNSQAGGGFVGELPNANSRPSSSYGKRKEPDTGWENYPYNLKNHHYPRGNT